MAAIKSYTDISQSKKLAEILPLESADMHFINDKHAGCVPYFEMIKASNPWLKVTNILSPCWSLASLLDVLPYKERFALAINDCQGVKKAKYAIGSVENDAYDCYADNPVDACVEMIIKFHEQKIL